jgi:peptidoglycan/xylan/chitin deacetylase (PgdA/CDA1 family)
MKRLIIFITVLIALSACTNNEQVSVNVKDSSLLQHPTKEVNSVKVLTDENIANRTKKEPLYYVSSDTYWYVKPIDDAPKNVVLLTIDDGPDKYSLEMANTLKELGVNAIFFVNGHFIDSPEEKAILKEIYDLGFEIGNHTWGHVNLRTLTEEEQKEAIISLSDEIEEIIGERPKFFRAPHGANTDFAKKVVEEDGMLLMNWSYGYDFMADYMDADALLDIMLTTNLLYDGANLLLHDRSWTNDALKDMVLGLQEKGYIILDPDYIKVP